MPVEQSVEKIIPQYLTAQAFAAYGEVIELAGAEAIPINSGNCLRYSDLVTLNICASGQSGVSLFDAQPYANPLALRYVERHPLGSQAFLPTNTDPYLIIVADDENDCAQRPKAFITSGYQGVNYFRNTWHGVLTPIVRQSLFVVVDYIGDGDNLQEHHFDVPFSIDFSAFISETHNG